MHGADFSRALQFVDLGLQPFFDGRFDFGRRLRAVERIQRLAPLIERDVRAGNPFPAAFRRHELHQDASRAVAPLPGCVQTGRGILEVKLRPPRGFWCVSIASTLEKREFASQNIQQIAVISSHLPAPKAPPVWVLLAPDGVTCVTSGCNSGHGLPDRAGLFSPQRGVKQWRTRPTIKFS